MIDFQKSGKWKVQLTTAINFTSSKDVDEECAEVQQYRIYDL